MKLTVIIPVYDERDTIRDVIERVLLVPQIKQVVVVDDGSRDGTAEVLVTIDSEKVRCITHQENRGKGAALRSAIPFIEGEAAVVQDADREYDPAVLADMLGEMERQHADILYGSRFLGNNRFLSRRQKFANRLLSGLTNLLYGSALTDMETCYKMMKRTVWEYLPLSADRFDIEPEITALALRSGYRITEIPVPYRPRAYAAGKKIGWRDALAAVRMLIRCRFRRIGP